MAERYNYGLVAFTLILMIAFSGIASATGSVIVFERGLHMGVNVGHIGVAVELENGSWIAGAIEGPGGLNGLTGTSGNNGGWWYTFNTKEEAIDGI